MQLQQRHARYAQQTALRTQLRASVRRPRVAARAAALEAAEAAPSTSAAYSSSDSDVGASRRELVTKHFDGAMDAETFIARVETALQPMGFRGANSIAVTNLCRDEATAILRDRIETAFGSAFNVMGLGGVLTCGCTGFGAGFSHSPVCPEGRERYVFFSLPHVAICEDGEVGKMARPGRPGMSAACGALIKALGEMSSEGVGRYLGSGLYDIADPEYSILKNRLTSQAVQESTVPKDLVSMTKLAERAITNDLEWLISKTVDTKKADYAVFTGVQIHNWANDLDNANSESFEFVWPTKAYAVVNGERKEIDLAKITPSDAGQQQFESGVQAVSRPYFMQRLIGRDPTKPKPIGTTAAAAVAAATPAAKASADVAAAPEAAKEKSWLEKLFL